MSLSVTIDNGTALWYCFRGSCGWSGRVRDPHFSLSPNLWDAYHPRTPGHTSSVAPPKRPPKLPRPSELLDLPPSMLEFFKERGISEATLARNGVRMQVAFSPQKKDWVPAIAFVYHWGGEMVNVKYRTLDKRFWQVRPETIFSNRR